MLVNRYKDTFLERENDAKSKSVANEQRERRDRMGGVEAAGKVDVANPFSLRLDYEKM